MKISALAPLACSLAVASAAPGVAPSAARWKAHDGSIRGLTFAHGGDERTATEVQ